MSSELSCYMNKIESVENDFTMKSGDVVPIRTRNLNEIKKNTIIILNTEVILQEQPRD